MGSNGCWTTPEFAPEAPDARPSPSTRVTRAPAAARKAAAAVPTIPPPMTTTSEPRASEPSLTSPVSRRLSRLPTIVR